MADSVKVGNVLYPAADVEAAVAFYGKALGLAVKFQDGTRFAALDGGGTTFAVAGSEEDVTGGRPAASFKVTGVPGTVERLLAAGAKLQRPAEEGPHEVRAVLLDPWGNPFVVYAPVDADAASDRAARRRASGERQPTGYEMTELPCDSV